MENTKNGPTFSGWIRLRVFLLLALSVFVQGCTSYLTLEPKINHVPSLKTIKKTVGVYYSPGLVNYLFIADPYHNKHSVEFPVGEASLRLFEQILPKIFDRVVLLNAWPDRSDQIEHLDAVLVPRISSFNYYSKNAGGWYYWATVTYKFNIYAPDGEAVTEWETKGAGMSFYDGGFNEKEAWAGAAESAIENAGKLLLGSFTQVPEAIRWHSGSTIDKLTVRLDAKELIPVRDKGKGLDALRFENRFSLGVITTAGDNSQNLELHSKLNAAGLVFFFAWIKNEGNHTLRVRREDLTITADETVGIGPLPASFFAAAAATYHGRLPPVILEPRYTSLIQLGFALVNLTAISGEQKEKEALAKIFQNEFSGATLLNGQEVKGLLFFAVPPDLIFKKTFFLTIPIIDLVEAKRYLVKIPLSLK